MAMLEGVYHRHHGKNKKCKNHPLFQSQVMFDGHTRQFTSKSQTQRGGAGARQHEGRRLHQFTNEKAENRTEENLITWPNKKSASPKSGSNPHSSRSGFHRRVNTFDLLLNSVHLIILCSTSWTKWFENEKCSAKRWSSNFRWKVVRFYQM